MKSRFERPRLPATKPVPVSDINRLGQKSRVSVAAIIEKYQKVAKGSSKLMGLSDATGSMESVWATTRRHIKEMIGRISGMGDFQMNWVAYRDYCDGSSILAASRWQDSAPSLLRFVDSIKCYGGGGNGGEAVERALEFAANDQKTTRVILIGDEPPHAHRDYRQQAERLAELKRPVFSFVVGGHPETIQRFKEISEISGGLSTELTDVNDLLDVVALTAADEIGREDMVTAYLERYSKHLSSGSKKYARLLLKGR